MQESEPSSLPHLRDLSFDTIKFLRERSAAAIQQAMVIDDRMDLINIPRHSMIKRRYNKLHKHQLRSQLALGRATHDVHVKERQLAQENVKEAQALVAYLENKVKKAQITEERSLAEIAELRRTMMAAGIKEVDFTGEDDDPFDESNEDDQSYEDDDESTMDEEGLRMMNDIICLKNAAAACDSNMNAHVPMNPEFGGLPDNWHPTIQQTVEPMAVPAETPVVMPAPVDLQNQEIIQPRRETRASKGKAKAKGN